MFVAHLPQKNGEKLFLRDLSSSKLKRWAVTGTFASGRLVTVAAPEIAVVYTDDPERLADEPMLVDAMTTAGFFTAAGPASDTARSLTLTNLTTSCPSTSSSRRRSGW